MEVKIVNEFESNGERNTHIITSSMVGFAMLSAHATMYEVAQSQVEAFAKQVNDLNESGSLSPNLSAIPDELLRNEAHSAKLEAELGTALREIDRSPLTYCDRIVIDLRISSGPIDSYILRSMDAAIKKVSLTRVRTILLVQPTD